MESKILDLTIYLYICYEHESHRSCNTTVYLSWFLYLEDFLGGIFHTGEHENCGSCNFRKHREIKNGEKYITLDISLDFGSLYKMKIISSEPKYYVQISGKGFITSLDLKTIRKSKKKKKSRYAINNVSLEGISKVIK